MQKNVALFVTCLVDIMRPQVGVAAIELLKQANCEVVVPPQQTCCGQPAYNSGARKAAKKLSKQVIDHFSAFDYIVVPSGSCTGMIRKHYPELLNDDPVYQQKALDIAGRTYELIEFLNDICQLNVQATMNKSVTYHSSCASLREAGLKDQPYKLLGQVKGCKIKPLPEATTCCGFGGTFCVKFPEISNKMVTDKVQNIMGTQAEVLTSVDLGCLMNIVGKLQKQHGNKVKALHLAEILANQGKQAGIGEPEDAQCR